MIIAIYGIPRSGKDTFINKVLDKKENSIHIKGSQTLNQISMDSFGCKFKELSSNKQTKVRKIFTKKVKEMNNDYELIIVDGHYSFPYKNEFNIVFTKNDLDLYDTFFYLNRTPEEILRNFNSDDKKDYLEYLTSSEKAKQWIEFEIHNMKKEVEKINKDFVVLDSDEMSVEYVSTYNKTSKQISEEIVKEITSKIKNDKLILTDLDKTISLNDLTNDYIQYSNLELSVIKNIFKGDYYTSYQFYCFHNYLNQSINCDKSIDYSISKIQLNEQLIENINSIKNKYSVIAITTGIKKAWEAINMKIQLFDLIYGFEDDNFIITPLIKKMVAKQLSLKYKVVAIGDSIIDLGMLHESNYGYLISMNKIDPRIVVAKKDSPKIFKNIYQIPYSKYKYDFIKVKELK